ncbi:MAG: hypothetical protein HQL52_04035 [Magnetococcales bacterium]|nr:hypothetical protein [Magnetococcales bacterium]
MEIKELVKDKLARHNNRKTRDRFRRIGLLLIPSAPEVVDELLDELEKEAELSEFFADQNFRPKLREAIILWLEALFTEKNDVAIEAFIDRQIEVGRKHADKQVNILYIHHGASILKRELNDRLRKNSKGKKGFLKSLQIIDELFDVVLSLVSISYIDFSKDTTTTTF